MKILYLSKAKFGGWVSFTANLAHLLDQPIYTYSKKPRISQFGYNKELIADDFSGSDFLITAVDKEGFKYLHKFCGSYLLIHDPTELTNNMIKVLKKFKIIVNRKGNYELLLNKYGVQSILINQPFFPYEIEEKQKNRAVAISRVDWDKFTHIILKANAISENKVDIYGAINPMYEFHKLTDLNFREYYKGEFKGFDEVANILSDAKFMVDMSAIKNDGGGTQFTFLEAMHAGSCLILNKKWVKENDAMIEGFNCLAVKDHKELAQILNSNLDVTDIVNNAKVFLKNHMKANDLWKELFYGNK